MNKYASSSYSIHENNFQNREIKPLRILKEHEISITHYEHAMRSLEESLMELGNLRDSNVDTPELHAKKKLLRQHRSWFITWKKKWQKLFEASSQLSHEQKDLIKQFNEEIRRFMDFFHNVQHDKRLNSLGQTRRFTHPYEKSLAAFMVASEVLRRNHIIYQTMMGFSYTLETLIAEKSYAIRKALSENFLEKEKRAAKRSDENLPMKQRMGYTYHIHADDITKPHPNHYWEDKVHEKEPQYQKARSKNDFF